MLGWRDIHSCIHFLLDQRNGPICKLRNDPEESIEINQHDVDSTQFSNGKNRMKQFLSR